MSSPAIARERTDPDEAALYLTTAAALGASLLAAGWASGSARVGAVGGALAVLGIWTGWRARDWPLGRRAVAGIIGALLAAGSLQALISWEVKQEVGAIYMAQGDIGLGLALRMGVLLVAFSFLLIHREMLPFSLVPGVTLFGLAGGRGISVVAFGCFLVFLPAALAALGQAMLLSGMPARRRTLETLIETATAADPGNREEPSGWYTSSWRRRHWSLLGSLIAAIIALGALIYLPVYTYGTQYYWPLAMMSLPSGRFGFLEGPRSSGEALRSYSVGQGPIAPGQSLVLSFTGEPVPLWRGEVFDNFTGNAWLSTDDEPVPLAIHRGELSIQRWFPPTSQDTLVAHEVRVEKDMPLVIYGPGQIQRALVPRRLGALMPAGIFVDKFGCVAAPGATLRAGAQYTVVSDANAFSDPSPGTRDSGLGSGNGRSLASSPQPLGPSPQPLGPLLDEGYLRIPLSSRRVADLARTITANAAAEPPQRFTEGAVRQPKAPLSAPSTDDKVRALVSYLQRECVYTLSAPAVPHGEDAADFFLLKSKRGYCDLFATAFAVMARSVGIPSRFVTGYAGGQYDPNSSRYLGRGSAATTRPAGGSSRARLVTQLRESDGHAWVEIYDGRRGWVTVDPTPGGGPVTLSLIQRLIASLQTLVRSHPLLDIGLWLAAIGALLAAAALLLRRQVGLRQLSLDRNDPRTVVLRAYTRLTRVLAARGRPRRPSQTPLEYLEAVERRSVEREATGRFAPRSTFHALAAVRALTELFLLARYSPHPITADTASLALAHLTQASEALRRRRRRW